jgi:hypothetical protein
VESGTEIQSRAADDDRDAASAGDLRNRSACHACVVGGSSYLGWIEHIDQVMRDALARSLRCLCRADIESAVELNRIAADDLAVEFLREGEPQRTFPRGGRPEDDEQRVIAGG